MARFSAATIFASFLLFTTITAGYAQTQYPVNLNKKLLLEMVNDARSKGCRCGKTYHPPAPPVKWNEKLEKAAQNHSNNMYSKSFFSHIGKDGSTVSSRVTTVKYDWVICAENIGMRYKTERAVVQAWINNPSHCENIMNELFTEMGVAIKGGYWTMVLALPR
ncbi:MAG: CAP domain-containing protein [Bacteroidales bacterium]|nr:CAP domain-containing protein [Bacteroidales bacterium]